MLILWAVLVQWGHLAAAASPPAWFRNDPSQPWHITADTVSQDRATGMFSASGDVVITHQAIRLSAERVQFNQTTMEMSAEGRVILTAGDDILTGERVFINLKTETGYLIDATLFSQATQFRIAGKRIEKRDKDSYRLDEGSVTTCDGERPAWRITCRSLDVTVEGYGIARSAGFRIREVPVLWVPFLAFPVKIERQTGLLVPQFGASERKGWEFTQPLFWAINDHSDATIYWNHMQQRGEKLGGEYRYAAGTDTFGAVMIDGFNDRQIDDGTPEATRQWGYPDDDVDRPNASRYWFRMKHDLDFGERRVLKLDADIVSDQDYLKAFENGYSGYNDTNGYFSSTFGRGLDDKDDPNRLNLASFSKTWVRYIVTADARWTDDAAARAQDATNTNIQELPNLNAASARQPLFNTPLVASGFGQYVHFYREAGQTGQRLDIYPRVYWPLKFRQYLSVEPSAGFRETIWHVDAPDGGVAEDKAFYSRPMADFQLDASSDIYRVFNAPGDAGNRWRHLIRPQISYAYVPRQDQGDLPFFDETDRIAAENQVTLTLINSLTSGGSTVTTKTRARPDQETEAAAAYFQLARLKLEQSFDINAAGDPNPEPLSPVYGELIISPRDRFSARLDGNYSVYGDGFEDHNVRLGWWDHRGDRINLEHRYTRDQSESLFAGLSVAVWEGVGAYGAIERDVKNDENIKTQVGILLDRQCWSLDTRYTESPNNREISFQITLRGIGGVGSGVDPGSLSGGGN
jgi:LPS-assembly protein